MKRTDLQIIMRRSWALFRTTGKTFSVCLSKAWQLYRLTDRMRAGVVRFAYEKADGTLRRACGTLRDIAATIKGSGRPDDGRTVKYYDIEAAGWRSFKVENLITVY
ncbi:SH3 beta-barrel fold-containing protein [uncultured Alistipes sp.]|uniref:SH3 beta-barrel fold-containing protein n=1 Tax=uncultured Alistipes sp. TaxID=538949 RepID=UPI0025FA7B1D|nr:SH3 beta-barrel fold-containing protein [uncultured Alistipes sp.]